jgi:O-antigen/teichoic acid export membrane protein
LPTSTQLEDTFSTVHLNSDLKARSVRGGLLTLTSQASQFLISTIATVVLARMLVPADFGLVAMVTAITGLGQGFADLGLSEATIQRENISHKQVNTLFWINVGIGLALTLVTVALAPVMAWFYRDSRLQSIAIVVSLTFLIGGLRVQHDALLRRQMRFLSLAIRDVAAWVVGVCVAVTLAWRGAGYWAIVILPLTVNLTVMLLSWAMVRWVPGLPRRDAEVRSMIAFGGNVATSYLLINLLRSADTVLIGRYWGAGLLGLYSRAFNLMMLPLKQINIPAGNVAIPAFSRLQDDPERMARYFLSTINLMTWIAAPIFGFLFVAAKPVIVLVLGKQWIEAAPVFKILGISALGHLVWGSIIWLFISRGQSGRLLKLTLITSPILVASYAIGLPFGIKGVAFTGSVGVIAILPLIVKMAFYGTKLTFAGLGRAMLYPTSISLVGVLLGELALGLIAPQRLISQFSVAALAFGAPFSLAVLIPSVREEVASLKKLFHGLRSSRQTV